ncbi:hypothetical protein GGR54DRAFT_650077 [Hypoxylon sp. NC1633]|nr:hypothetical protein GGR54DRAFT_650077 [Hypoxylon sp. NC1633]
MARLLTLFTTLLSLLSLVAAHDEALHLNVTTITARDHVSVLECWQMTTPFATIAGGLKTLGLGDLSNGMIQIAPPGIAQEPHNAPYKQYLWVITGIVHITLPNATGEASIYGGKYGLMYAEDTKDISRYGHVSWSYGRDEMLAVSFPVKNNVNPAHKVLHHGPCEEEELIYV